MSAFGDGGDRVSRAHERVVGRLWPKLVDSLPLYPIRRIF